MKLPRGGFPVTFKASDFSWSAILYTANDLHSRLAASALRRNIGDTPTDFILGQVKNIGSLRNWLCPYP